MLQHTTAGPSDHRLAGGRVPRLHVLTDTRGGRDPLPDVHAALRGGAGVIQVRAKECTDRAAVALTRAVLEAAAPYAALVLVDDRVDVALVAGAHGVHVGEHDLEVADVRALAGRRFVVGATARTPSAARAAQEAGATYLGVGPAAPTSTKAGLPAALGPEGIGAVAAATSLPVIAIGGVTADLVPRLVLAGAHGVAVVSAVSQAPDPAAATAAFAAALPGEP
ncbi:MAG TPA: thiamine phosphate synthase [Intrasporangium sp.]|uniref:thiamine phosphate synthase n=1 Tax=Intrasporangium sp. TaxID=1925024 RepID=UPI002D7897E8|nr:thiamine phosphate synthase [Intrasporangium sp.]HET7397966.1 thiamine phosphate synthase [Intrasporangium sp.]